MINAQRSIDWQRVLNAHVVAAQEAYGKDGLRWGVFDCCTFAFDWVFAATGVDPMADYRGEYASEIEAREALRATGHATLEGALTATFGEPIAPATARRGDLVFRKTEKAVGIVITQGARQVGLFLGEAGFSALPMRDCDLAFRVGVSASAPAEASDG